MRETDEFYFFWKHQFGQWTIREISAPDGNSYNCCEQYMMYQKALLFSDLESANKIINEKDPAKQQQMGREIRNFNNELWDKHKIGIVWYGNYLKFIQHKDLNERLIATGNKTLVEASPYDLVWGVGYAANDDKILIPSNWRGLNLLGKILMSVRTTLQFQDYKF